MNDHQSDELPARGFVPAVKPLESRTLLSLAGSVGFTPLFPRLPRTGGVSAQMGSLVAIGVGQPTSNTVQIQDDGAGHVQAEWNGGPAHSFAGVTSTVVQAERAGRNHVAISLTGARTGPAAIAVGSMAPVHPATPVSGRHIDHLRSARTTGSAVQSGSLVTVTVNRPKVDVVQITDEGGGAVGVEWNGGPVHSFSGVETIVIDTRNARKDQITLIDPAH